VISGILAFCNAVSSLERDAAVIVVAVAENEVATVFPRKNHLAQWMRHPDSYSPDIRNLKEHILTGIAELIERAAVKQQSSPSPDPTSREAAMAAGFSTALCILNRLLVAAKAGGVSALPSQHYMDRVDDQGVVAMMDSSSSKQTSNRPASAWSPRILLVQASEDRSQDYNAIMNCAFAANKNHVTVDGCFLTAGSPGSASSSFLEQVCDLTGGIYSAPSGMSQIGGALTEVLLSVFLAPLPSRDSLHLPTGHKVDFRARCFESAAIVDRAFVCNQCLSIFRQKPTQLCPTCQAKIVESKRK
jgi:transcription initiation factor TFIIH subunit 3